MNIWEILQIPTTKDVAKIKKAFSLQSSKYHPEEHPHEFQALYRAYKSALSLAENKRDDTIELDFQFADEKQVFPAADPAGVSYQEQWATVDHYTSAKQTKIDTIIKDLNSLLDSKNTSEKDWSRILKSAEFLEVRDEKELIEFLVTRLHARSITSWQTGELLWQAYQLERFLTEDEKGIYTELYEFLDYMRIKRMKSEKQKKDRDTQQTRKIPWSIWIVIAVIIFFIRKLAV